MQRDILLARREQERYMEYGDYSKASHVDKCTKSMV